MIILKSSHNCRRYGSDKKLTLKSDLDLKPTRTNVLNGTSTRDGEQLCEIILKYIHNCRSYGPDNLGRTHARTHGRMHVHRIVVVTTMPRSPQVGSKKSIIFRIRALSIIKPHRMAQW